MRICDIENCSNATRTPGQALCGKHYRRKQRHGDPNINLLPKDNRPAHERWKDSYTVDEQSGCWNWTGPKERPDGYGFITNGAGSKNRYMAHRFVWVQSGGVLEDGMDLDHLCFNKGCVNPEHLEQVSHLENVRRGGVNGSNYLKTYCDHGHEFTPENTYTRSNGWRQCRACARRLMRQGKYRSAYTYLYLPGHPIADKSGRIQVHRAVLYESIGPGPHPCHWCGAMADWGGIGGIHVDHLNGEPADNRLGNLVPSCQHCNKSRASKGNPVDWKRR